MTFFTLEQRHIHKNQKDNYPLLGPGKYDYNLEQKQIRQRSYAPFGSLTSKKNNKSQDISLGPGEYNISTSIIKPSITKYENKNIIIVKINDEGGHQFKSRCNRFKEIQASSVGPGSYYLRGSSEGRKRVMSSSLHRPKIAEKVRLINQHYHQERKPTLLSDPLLTQQRQKTQTPKAKGVVSWSLNKKQRFDMLIKQQFNEQDKQKALSDFNDCKKKKKNKPSAVFLSKSIKSHIETQIYKTNNPFKAELRKMIDFKDQQPGPGTYEPLRASSNKILPKFQFFGSTVERFPQRGIDPIGPGSYQMERKMSPRQQRQNISYSQQRHSYLPKNLIPGPGSYSYESNFAKNSYFEKPVQTAFGTQQERFAAVREGDNSAIDNSFVADNNRQRQQKRQKQIKLLKRIAQDHPSAVFSSKTNRFAIPELPQIEIGTYDITQNDINSRVAKQQRLIKQLEQCQLHKPPFLSSDERFKQIKIHESQHRNCWCQVKSVEKQMIEHESPAFISNQKRTAVFEQPFKAPPVGYYQNNDRNMVKNSFNSRFKKKNENIIKKDIVLRHKNKMQSQLKTETSNMEVLKI